MSAWLASMPPPNPMSGLLLPDAVSLLRSPMSVEAPSASAMLSNSARYALVVHHHLSKMLSSSPLMRRASGDFRKLLFGNYFTRVPGHDSRTYLAMILKQSEVTWQRCPARALDHWAAYFRPVAPCC